ncbi:MAG TPA: electron transfer flavoprotein subunit alpha/FixB family protein [Spirochaetia bacterium]|nr:electron transfer flavoprotein subunit alpha/FixB family protein [Spirochaetia bacterium]
MEEAYSGIMVYAEAAGSGLKCSARELMGHAGILAAKIQELENKQVPVSAVILGPQNLEPAKTLTGFAGRVYWCDRKELTVYHPGLYAGAITGLVEKYRPEIVMFAAGPAGSELAATCAARLKTGLAAHAVELEINRDGHLVQLVVSYGENIMGEILCPAHRPQMVTVQSGILEPPVSGTAAGELIREEIDLRDDGRLTITAIEGKGNEACRLEEAEVVLAGGYGLKNKKNWLQLEELADLLGAATGCTRPVLDEHWVDDEDLMIGISGKTIHPRVYLGIGISGSSHHTAGIQKAGWIIAVNNDVQARLLQMADLRIVGDGPAIVAEMIKIIKGGNTST